MSEEENISIKVVKLLDEYKIVINKGANDGIKVGQVFLVYKEDEELFDPDTNESLGRLEIVKGKGKPSLCLCFIAKVRRGNGLYC